jgi:hypothetical protein
LEEKKVCSLKVDEGRSKMQFISKKALSEITPKIILNFNFVDQIFFSTVVGFMQ